MASDLEKVASDQLHAMLAAGVAVLGCHRVLAKTGDNIVSELIKGHETFYEWDHYPPGDVYDSENDSQFYYHAHPQSERVGEHGHFHTFLHPEVIPAGAKPVAEAAPDKLEEDETPLCHLIGISMDSLGIPIRFFTTNRWVTGEILYSAETIIGAFDRFEIDLAQPSWPVNIWVTNMIRLYGPQLKSLLRERDKAFDDRLGDNSGGEVFEDRKLEIMSSLDISVDDQIETIRNVLIGRGETVLAVE